MKKLFLLLFLSSVIFSQQLFIPKEIKNAYEKGTRSYDGRPGSSYWQNTASYIINAELIENTNKIKGKAKITYYNNSPDVLTSLWIRAYQNINRADTRKDYTFDPVEFNEGMIFSKLTVNGRNINLENSSSAIVHGTNIEVEDVMILPGEDASIESEWEFTIPSANAIRMGNYNDNFFIAYWYPQVAVYDDIDGWDETPYAGMVEFYNDFNDYDVKLTVPSGFNLWATGELLNPDDVMKGKVRERYTQAMNSESVIRIVRSENIGEELFSNNIKTYHFTANDVPDFSFCASKNFLWDGCIVNVIGKKVFVSAMYSPEAAAMHDLAEISARAIELFSTELPGYPYPYPALTIFNGSGGMEFPMMVNQGGGQMRMWTISTAVHEIAHMYFPFYMGINERKYAWMDEGWAQMLSEDIKFKIEPFVDYRAQDVERYLHFAGTMQDVPLMIESRSFNDDRHWYDHAAYFRSCVAYNMMIELFGRDVFKGYLLEYMNRWNGKHPTPYDFFYTFNNVSGSDLNWFWKPWFFEIGAPDLAIKNVTNENGRIRVIVEKIGNLPVPVELKFVFQDGREVNVEQNLDYWKDGAAESVIEIIEQGTLERIQLGNEYIPDIDRSNNIWQR
jgi:hypothetical protein